MKIQIKNRFTGKIILEGEAKSIKELLEENKKISFQEADLRGANLWKADLRGIDFRGANLWRVNLWGANLRGANLWETNLRKADLQETNLWKAEFRGANLLGANFWRTKISKDQRDDLLKAIGVIVK